MGGNGCQCGLRFAIDSLSTATKSDEIDADISDMDKWKVGPKGPK